MRTDRDVGLAITAGLARIREEFEILDGFPAEVLATAVESARRRPAAEHVDRTDLHFVTLDPATSTDLDQAFHLERDGDDLLLRYAIADVGFFVDPGDPVDLEAWRRGATVYLPDGRVGLYPPVLSEAAASLLPDGPRPAVIFTVRLDAEGAPRIDQVERAVIRSRAKLAYDAVGPADLPPELDDFSRRIAIAEDVRGAARVDSPEQEVEAEPGGGFRIAYRPRLASEDVNSAMSLATNLAVADLLFQAGTGLYRVMDEPDERTIQRLRHSARAGGLDWPGDTPLAQFEKSLDPTDPRHAAFMLAIRRAGGGASYEPYREGVVPWHAAMAATYSHTTAPLRRLADRYVVLAALALANGHHVPPHVTEAFDLLPDVMRRADQLGNQVERVVIDLVESIVLQGQEGRTFEAIVTDADDRGVRVQLCDIAVVARVDAKGAEPGDTVRVKLVSTDPERREVRFDRVA